MPKIDRILAYIAEDAGPDDEGIAAFWTQGGWVPLVGADMARMASLRPAAEMVSRDTGKRLRLVEFSTRQELEVVG